MAIKFLPGFALSALAWMALCPSDERNAFTYNELTDRSRPAAPERAPGRTVFSLLQPEQEIHARTIPLPARAISFANAFPATAPASPSVAAVGEFVSRPDPVRFSASALAALNDLNAGGTSEPGPAPAYPALPPKGIAVRAGGGSFREEQQAHEWGQSVYAHKGSMYSLDIEYDWSIDSVVGASIGMVSSTLKSLQDADSRENRMQAYVAGAHYRGSLFSLFPVETRAFYGWVDHEGSGEVGKPGTAVLPNPWKEDAHHSTMYGASATVGLPLLFLNSLKVLPEAGVRYTTLKTKGYSVGISDYMMPIRMPQTTSTSIAVPISVTAKMDFPRIWGLATPRAGYGVEMEFDETAGGVHAMNSPAASRMHFDSLMMPINQIAFDPAHRLLFHVNLGLDVKTAGGWEISAEYKRKWVSTYTRDDFRLEIGRCF